MAKVNYTSLKLKTDNSVKTFQFHDTNIDVLQYLPIEDKYDLVMITLQKAKEMGYPFVLIAGNPNYYHRFGFESASMYNIYLEGMNQAEEADFFMIKVFDKEVVKQYKGVLKFAPCYIVDKEEFEKFDEEFKKKEGQ